MTQRKGPVVIELDAAEPDPAPQAAPPVPEAGEIGAAPTTGHAVQGALDLVQTRVSWPLRLFWSALGTLLTLVLSIAAWDFVTGLLARSQALGALALALGAAVLAGLGLWVAAEAAALKRLHRLDGLRADAEAAIDAADLAAARAVLGRIDALYARRDELSWGRSRLKERTGDVFDADALVALAEAEVMAPLDAAAEAEIAGAARQVATITAIVPLALADVAAALVANLRMIRRIAEIYGGRGGSFGNWRLARRVIGHLAVTGAVSVGDDLVDSLIGGGLVGKLSRRFGEGVVNGALTARVGVAAMELCRPLPFGAGRRPRVRRLVQRALAGLFAAG